MTNGIFNVSTCIKQLVKAGVSQEQATAHAEQYELLGEKLDASISAKTSSTVKSSEDSIKGVLRELRASMEAIETKMEAVESKMEAVETKMEAIETKMEARMDVLEGMIKWRVPVTTAGFLLAVIGIVKIGTDLLGL